MGPSDAAMAAIMANLPWTALLLQDAKVAWLSADEAFGWPASSLMGGTLSLLWHPDDREEAHRMREEAEAGRPHASMLRVMTRQGEERHVDVAMGAAQGAGCLVTLHDVTERLLAEHRATQAEREIALFAEFAGDLLCMTDPDRRVTWASASVKRLLGWEAHELIGTFMADLIHPDDRYVMHPLGASQDGDALVRLRSRDGSYRWMARMGSGPSSDAMVDAFTDVDAFMRSQDHLRREAIRLDAILQSLPLPHLLLAPIRDCDGTVVDFAIEEANREALAFLASQRNDVVGASIESFLSGPHASLTARLRDALTVERMLISEDWQLDEPAAQARRIELHAASVADRLSVTWRDVTEARSGLDRLQDSECRYRLLAENASDAVAWLRDGIVQWASGSVTSMLGWLPDDWTDRRLEEFVHVDDLEGFMPLRAMTVDPKTGEPGHCATRFRIRSKDLRYHWVEAHARPFLDADGCIDGVATSLRIIDAEVQAMRELDRQARTDDLTGLLNRREVLQRISSMGANSRRTGEGIAVLFCDVDRFKEVNDHLGHAVGDLMLKTLAHRVEGCVRSGDFAARVGGDEILVVLDGVHGVADAMDIAEKIRIAASMPMDLPDASGSPATARQACVTMSIGVVLVTSVQEVGDAVSRADEAMYQAKRSGANRVFCLSFQQESSLLIGSC